MRMTGRHCHGRNVAVAPAYRTHPPRRDDGPVGRHRRRGDGGVPGVRRRLPSDSRPVAALAAGCALARFCGAAGRDRPPVLLRRSCVSPTNLCGGFWRRAGARLAERQGAPASRFTLLRLLRNEPEPELPTPRVLGVDDLALRRSWSIWRRTSQSICWKDARPRSWRRGCAHIREWRSSSVIAAAPMPKEHAKEHRTPSKLPTASILFVM